MCRGIIMNLHTWACLSWSFLCNRNKLHHEFELVTWQDGSPTILCCRGINDERQLTSRDLSLLGKKGVTRAINICSCHCLGPTLLMCWLNLLLLFCFSDTTTLLIQISDADTMFQMLLLSITSDWVSYNMIAL